jgi:alanine racemase
MNIVSDPKSIPAGSVLSPEANRAAALATATGVLTVDLDAIIANWRKLEKTAVPANAGVIKATPMAAAPIRRPRRRRRLQDVLRGDLDEACVVRAAVPSAAIYVLATAFPEQRRRSRRSTLGS